MPGKTGKIALQPKETMYEATAHVNGGVKVYRRGGAKVYQLAHDGLMLF